ncbi:MAG: hypothetical protein J6T04_01140 [Bacteroidales bacterium]|nr:hypothetical protein [Bacteroidales bacterium]
MKLSIFAIITTLLISSCEMWNNVSEEDLVGTTWVASNGSTISFYKDSVRVINMYVFDKCPLSYEAEQLYIDSLVQTNIKIPNIKNPIDSISFRGTWRAERSYSGKQGGIWIDAERDENGYGYTFQFSSVEYYSISLKRGNRYGFFLDKKREILWHLRDPDDWECLVWEEKL